MSCASYSRNKYRCLLRPNHNVIVSNDNINESKPTPQPRYPYGYPGYGYSNYGYPGYGYPGYGYPNYDYGYGYSYPGVYPGTRPYPYVAKINEDEKIPKPRSNPKNEKMSQYEYYSSSSSSSDDECYTHPYRCHPDRYYRRYATQDVNASPQRVFDEQNQKPFPIPKPTPNPPRPRPPPPSIPAIEINHEHQNEIKNKNQFAKPFAKLLAKMTMPNPNDSNDSIVIDSSEEKNEDSLGDSNLLEFKNEIESAAIDSSMCNLSIMNEKKIYLKV